MTFAFSLSANAQIAYRLDSNVSEKMTNGQWEPSGVMTYEHNGGDYIASWKSVILDANGDRRNSQQAQFTYNTQSGLLEKKESQYWSGSTSAWVNSQLKEYKYANAKLVAINSSNWQSSTNSWKHSAIDSSIYDANGDLIRKTVYTTKQGVFEPYSKREFVYKTSGLLDSSRYGIFYGSTWVAMSAQVSYQDANGRDTASNQYSINVNNGNYSLQMKYRYLRNTTGDCIRSETKKFDFLLGEWVVISAFDFEVNGLVKWKNVLFDEEFFGYGYFENTLTRTLAYITQTGGLSPSTRSTYYYDSQLPNSVVNPENVRLRIFPNPCGHTFQLELEQFQEASSLMIYDLQGRLLINKSIQQNTQIDVSELVSGMYMLQLLDDTGKPLGRAKFVKE